MLLYDRQELVVTADRSRTRPVVPILAGRELVTETKQNSTLS